MAIMVSTVTTAIMEVWYLKTTPKGITEEFTIHSVLPSTPRVMDMAVMIITVMDMEITVITVMDMGVTVITDMAMETTVMDIKNTVTAPMAALSWSALTNTATGKPVRTNATASQ